MPVLHCTWLTDWYSSRKRIKIFYILYISTYFIPWFSKTINNPILFKATLFKSFTSMKTEWCTRSIECTTCNSWTMCFYDCITFLLKNKPLHRKNVNLNLFNKTVYSETGIKIVFFDQRKFKWLSSLNIKNNWKTTW